MALPEPVPGARWLLAAIQSDGGGGWTNAAFTEHAAPGLQAYYPPLNAAGTGYVVPWALVAAFGPLAGGLSADIVVLPDLALTATLNSLTNQQRTQLRNALEARCVAYGYTDYKGVVKQISQLSGGSWSPATTTWRDVLQAILAWADHSTDRPRDPLDETHNTLYTDNFDSDTSANWTDDTGGSSPYTRDAANGEIDGSAWDNDSRLRYSANAPGSMEHEVQVTLLTAAGRAVGGGARMAASSDESYGVAVLSGSMSVYRNNAGVNTLLLEPASFYTQGNFVTLRMACSGANGANVVLDFFFEEHTTSKPSDPGAFVGTVGAPSHTYTDTAADRLDDSTIHLYGGLAGRGPLAGHDPRIDYWRVQALSDRAGADESAGRLFIRTTHRPAAFAPGRSR